MRTTTDTGFPVEGISVKRESPAVGDPGYRCAWRLLIRLARSRGGGGRTRAPGIAATRRARRRGGLGIDWSAVVVGFSLSACGDLEPECSQPDAVDGEPDLRVLTYNLGNGDATGRYALRIADQSYEDHVGQQLRLRDADIVLLQEVLTPNRCALFEELDPGFTCFMSTERPAPVERILGDGYSVVCDANQHVECIGVKVSWGGIRGVPLGGFDIDHARTVGLPGPACDYVGGTCDGTSTDCDAESSISTIVVDTPEGAIRVIHAHPSAIGEICLSRQLRQVFGFVDELPTVLGGDWNFDPSRLADVAVAGIWADWVGENRRFHNHLGYTKGCELERTSVAQNASLDRVVTDFARGSCRVWTEPRLDDGFDFVGLIGRRSDHYAVECELEGAEP